MFSTLIELIQSETGYILLVFGGIGLLYLALAIRNACDRDDRKREYRRRY